MKLKLGDTKEAFNGARSCINQWGNDETRRRKEASELMEAERVASELVASERVAAHELSMAGDDAASAVIAAVNDAAAAVTAGVDVN